MFDLAIVGGGIIGLSTAYQLSLSGMRIVVVDKALHSRQASWAAAGLVPPANPEGAPDAYERLRAFSRSHLLKWCNQLARDTGIDPELRHRGSVHVARTPGELAALNAAVAQWRAEGISVESLDSRRTIDIEPALTNAVETEKLLGAFYVPDEATLRPPRLLKALTAACKARGVDWCEAQVTRWKIDDRQATASLSSGQRLLAKKYCVCGGAWSASQLSQLGINAEIVPWRGQMLLWQSSSDLVRRVVYEGPNYIVPRDDGLYLVGSTMEDAGFQGQTTTAAHDVLRDFGVSLLPQLATAKLIQHWAGFRPGTADGDPIIGRIEPLTNVYVATGHFRSGIAMAAGTAAVLDDLINDRTPPIDVSSFRPNR